MADAVAMALEVARELRRSAGYRALESRARAALDHDLARIESRLVRDPYAQVMDASFLQDRLRAPAATGRPPATARTPAAGPHAQALDASFLQDRLRGSAGAGPSGTGGGAATASPPAPPPPPPTPQTAAIGQRTADALQAVNFPGFVASLLTGTFQAIVDASAQQVREYAKLVASITQSLEEFSDQNVTPNQARDHLAQQYPNDLMVQFPAPGTAGQPRLLPRPDREGESPAWLEKFKLGGEELTQELTEGPLLEAGRHRVGEDRLQTLATMVLMGINRVVVNEGDVRAKLQFHATATDSQNADLQVQSASIAGRNVNADVNTQMMVSTLKVNAQADASIKADLMGEVRISFRSETFPLERFADSAAIQLLNKHARWRGDAGPPAGAARGGAAGAPASTVNTTIVTAPAPGSATVAPPASAAPEVAK